MARNVRSVRHSAQTQVGSAKTADGSAGPINRGRFGVSATVCSVKKHYVGEIKVDADGLVCQKCGGREFTELGGGGRINKEIKCKDCGKEWFRPTARTIRKARG